jgi:hypothetical protein
MSVGVAGMQELAFEVDHTAQSPWIFSAGSAQYTMLKEN